MRPSRAALTAALLAGALVSAGCSGGAPDGQGAAPVSVRVPGGSDAETFHGTLVEPAMPRPDLVLPTTGGEPFDVGDRPDGEMTLLFFGYTHCPDLCPTTMADLAVARDMLAPEVRERVEVLFVTEDPARDTPELLRDWLDRFDPQFTGLIGGDAATAAALEQLYLPETAQVADPSEAIVHPHEGDGHSHGDYSVDHAGVVYAWGPGGRSLVYTGGTTPEQYAEDLTRLAATG
jgi:protein SCO1/2